MISQIKVWMHFLSGADKPLIHIAEEADFRLDLIATLERQNATYKKEVDEILNEAESYVANAWP